MDNQISIILRNLPSVSDFMQTDAGRELIRNFGEGMLKLELRRLLDEIRMLIRSREIADVPGPETLAVMMRDRLERMIRPAGRHVINATGIILHTNLGRAPLCPDAIEAVSLLNRYSLLEISIESGKRAHRDEWIEPLIRELTGCEAATIVNNNAAAIMIILNEFFKGREVIISRGQLVEIGGTFRMPDIMKSSGAIMQEVGTTNRTHLRDYEDAIHENTGGIVHVHNSNFRIRGYTTTPDIRELCELGQRRGLPVVDDLGSGAMVPLGPYGLPEEPLVQDSIKAGADVVCFSGDKLIGGPQSGIICGKKAFIDRIRKNPFSRMFRVDKMTIAALQATLVHLVNRELTRIPLYRMLSRNRKELEEQADRIVQDLKDLKGLTLSVEDGLAFVGSGAIPDEGIAGKVVCIRAASTDKRFSAEEKSRQMRTAQPSVFCCIRDNALVFDMRTVAPDEVDLLIKAIRKAFEGG